MPKRSLYTTITKNQKGKEMRIRNPVNSAYAELHIDSPQRDETLGPEMVKVFLTRNKKGNIELNIFPRINNDITLNLGNKFITKIDPNLDEGGRM